MDHSQVELGRSAVHVSPMGTGTMDWGFANDNALSESRSAFNASLAGGIDFYDTAEMYGFGKSERLTGEFIRASQRQVVVATKFFPYPWRWSRHAVVAALERSLARLGLSRVDLYQIHWPSPLVPIETWMDGLADAVEKGLTRAVGVSNYNPAQTRRAHAALARRGVPLASNQVQYSLLARNPERSGLVETCRELGVTIIAYSPLRIGLLTGKYSADHPPKGHRGLMFRHDYLRRIQPLIDLLVRIGEAHGRTPAQVALNWLICKGAVPIPGAKNARQAQENAGALGWRLTDEEMAQLDAASNL